MKLLLSRRYADNGMFVAIVLKQNFAVYERYRNKKICKVD